MKAMKTITTRQALGSPRTRRRRSFSLLWKSNVRLLVATMVVGLLCVANMLIRSSVRSPTTITTTISRSNPSRRRKTSSHEVTSFLQEKPSHIISQNEHEHRHTIINSTSSTVTSDVVVVLHDMYNNNNERREEQEELIKILESLDYDTKAICGGYKCFFRVRNDVDNIAYLVSINPIHGDGYLRLHQAYELAQTLEKEYPQIQHFLLGPPKKLYNLTKEWANQLNSNLIGQQKTVQKWLNSAPHNDTNKHRYGTRYLPYENINIQKVKLAPNPHLIIGCEGGKFKETLRDIQQLVVQKHSVSDKVNFIRNFEENVNYAKQVVQKGGKYSCLVWDFQLLLDVHGNLYHIDLDRCFRHVQEEYNNNRCFRNLHKVIRTLKQEKQDTDTTTIT